MPETKLTFKSDKFRILQITDTHINGFTGREGKVFPLLRRIIELEQPDLAAFTGDIACSQDVCVEMFGAVNALMEEFGIPYTYTYGNHETDGCAGSKLEEVLLKYPLSLYQKSPEGVPGFGNYRIPVFAGENSPKPAWYLYSIDCGNDERYNVTPKETVSHEGYIKRGQIDWVRRVHSEDSAPSVVFCHIPLPEFNDVWMFDGVYGERHEKVYRPALNSGFFTAMWELGNFRGFFSGHDHVNSYYGYMMGIMLAYGRNSGTHCRCRRGFKRGCRVIDLSADGSLSTHIRLSDGSVPEETFRPAKYDRFNYFVR